MLKKLNIVVWGVTPPTHFVTSIEEDFALNIKHTYVQVHSSPSREFVHFEKVFFLAFFRQCRPGVLLLDAAKQLKIVSVCQEVRSDVFSSAVQQTLRAVVLRESGIHYTF